MTNKEAIYRQDVLDLAKKGVLISNGNYESVCKAINEILPVNPQPCEDAISRQAVIDAIDVKAWEFCDYLISKNRNDEQKPVSHFADNLRECVREELPSVNPQPKYCDRNICVSNEYNGVGCDECEVTKSQEPKTGHWIWCFGSHKCSNCEEYTCFSHKELLRYCPNCGAKMVELQESEG